LLVIHLNKIQSVEPASQSQIYINRYFTSSLRKNNKSNKKECLKTYSLLRRRVLATLWWAILLRLRVTHSCVDVGLEI